MRHSILAAGIAVFLGIAPQAASQPLDLAPPIWLACEWVVARENHAVVRGKPEVNNSSSKERQVYVLTRGNDPKLQWYEPFRKTVSYREKAVIEGGKLLIRDSINYPGRNGGSTLRGAISRKIDLGSLAFTETGNGFTRDYANGMTIRWRVRGRGKCTVVGPQPLAVEPAS